MSISLFQESRQPEVQMVAWRYWRGSNVFASGLRVGSVEVFMVNGGIFRFRRELMLLGGPYGQIGLIRTFLIPDRTIQPRDFTDGFKLP